MTDVSSEYHDPTYWLFAVEYEETYSASIYDVNAEAEHELMRLDFGGCGGDDDWFVSGVLYG